jgi:hypothetical protein
MTSSLRKVKISLSWGPLFLLKSCSGFLFKVPFHGETFFHVALDHNPTTNITNAFTIIHSNSHTILPLITILKPASARDIFQPLLLPLLLSEPLLERTHYHLSEADHRLDDLEELMGQHEYLDWLVSDSFEMDFLSTTRTLNSPGKRVGVDVVRATCWKTVFENMASWGRDIAREK